MHAAIDQRSVLRLANNQVKDRICKVVISRSPFHANAIVHQVAYDEDSGNAKMLRAKAAQARIDGDEEAQGTLDALARKLIRYPYPSVSFMQDKLCKTSCKEDAELIYNLMIDLGVVAAEIVVARLNYNGSLENAIMDIDVYLARRLMPTIQFETRLISADTEDGQFWRSSLKLRYTDDSHVDYHLVEPPIYHRDPYYQLSGGRQGHCVSKQFFDLLKEFQTKKPGNCPSVSVGLIATIKYLGGPPIYASPVLSSIGNVQWVQTPDNLSQFHSARVFLSLAMYAPPGPLTTAAAAGPQQAPPSPRPALARAAAAAYEHAHAGDAHHPRRGSAVGTKRVGRAWPGLLGRENED
jgi:hypothetical protein